MADKKQLPESHKPADDNLEDVLAWLEDLALDEPDEPTVPPTPASPAPTAVDPAFLQDDAGLSWLDQITSGDGDPMDEPPTLSWEETRPIKDLLSPSLPLTAGDGEDEQASFDAAINWLDELAEQPAESVSDPIPTPPPPPPVVAAPPPPPAEKKKKGGMFGDDYDFSVSDEELASAVAHGAKVEGFDMPDDDEAAMAWLEGLLGDDGDLFGSSDAPAEPEPIAEPEPVEEMDLGALMAEALVEDAPPAPPVVAEVAPPPVAAPAPAEKKKKGGMFGDDYDFSVSDEELASAVAHGAKVEGFDMPDDDEAAMAWLEGLLGDDGDLFGSSDAPAVPEPIAEPEPEPEPILTEDSSLEDLLALAFGDENDTAEEEDGDLTWLDSMVADETASVDEPELIVADLGDFPDDPDEAMRMLEMLAASQQEDDDAPPVDNLLADEVNTADWDPAPLPTASADTDLLGDFDLGAGLDDDSLSWLGGVDTAAADDDLFAADLGDLPEDPDEAMALLERLSAAQNNAVDLELEDGPMPIFDDYDDPAQVVAEAGEFALDFDPTVELAAVEEAPAADSSLPDVQELFADDVSSSLPDWLSMEPAGTSDFDPLAWLDTDFATPDSGVLGWLAAEEEVTKKTGPKSVAPPPQQTTPPAGKTAAPERRKTTGPLNPQIVSQPPVAKPIYDPAIFQPARQLITKGDVEGALKHYEQFLEAGNAPVLIDELERVVGGISRHPLLRRTLGDAYMQNGQMQEALDMYIIARDQL